MNRILAVLAFLLVLGGCASLSKPIEPTTTVDWQKRAYAAKLAFQGLAGILVDYIETPRCDKPTSPPVCSKQAVVDIMRNVLMAGKAGTQAAEDAARALTVNTTSLEALVVAAEKSVAAAQSLVPAK